MFHKTALLRKMSEQNLNEACRSTTRPYVAVPANRSVAGHYLESLGLFFAATRNGRDRLRWSLYPPCLTSARATFVSVQVQMNYCSM